MNWTMLFLNVIVVITGVFIYKVENKIPFPLQCLWVFSLSINVGYAIILMGGLAIVQGLIWLLSVALIVSTIVVVIRRILKER